MAIKREGMKVGYLNNASEKSGTWPAVVSQS
jgi:hypothetical protein